MWWLKGIKLSQKTTRIGGSIKVGKKSRGVIFWQKPSLISLVFSVLAFLSIGISLLSVSVPVIPWLWYRLNPNASAALAEVLSRPVVTFGDLLDASGGRSEDYYQPPVDPSLPKDNLVIIPKIGVTTTVNEATSQNFESALKNGVWRVPDFGTAYQRNYPMILVAHRFGYLNWSQAFRLKNSFFNLPKLSQGDKIEVIWDQRRYTYEVYGAGEGEKITDYQADLILYTCKYLQSPVRIFRYARLLRI